jgi:hypothetical protein
MQRRRVAAIERRLNAAPDCPWTLVEECVGWSVQPADEPGYAPLLVASDLVAPDIAAAAADLAAHAPDDLRWLLDRLRDTEQQVG